MTDQAQPTPPTNPNQPADNPDQNGDGEKDQ